MGNLKTFQKDSITPQKSDKNSTVDLMKIGLNSNDKICKNLSSENKISNVGGISNQIKRENKESFSDISNSELSTDIVNPDFKKVDTKLNLLEMAYDRNNKGLKIKDPSSRFFLKVKNCARIEKNCQILIGFTKITLQILKDNSLSMKFNQGKYKNMRIIIYPKENSPIHIGRSQKNEFVLQDMTVSRVHCRIIFKESNWFVYDGVSDCASSDGVWIRLDRFYPFLNNFVIKEEDSTNLIKIEIRENSFLFYD